MTNEIAANTTASSVKKHTTTRTTASALSTRPASPFADPDEERFIPTCKREMLAWWMLSFANEPLSTVALAFSLPLLLESLPRSIGHLPGSPGTRCSMTGPCVALRLGGYEVSTSSFALYVTAISRLMPIILFIFVGPLADFCCWRKRLLTVFTTVGSLAAMLFLTILTPSKPRGIH